MQPRQTSGRPLLPVLLALIFGFSSVFLASDLNAAQISVRQVGNQVQVSGGTGSQAWHIQYGTTGYDFMPRFGFKPVALDGPGPLAYFTNGTWLRRVDAEKGLITGRWHFPGDVIKGVRNKDGHLQVQVFWFDPSPGFSRWLDFDPDNPAIPDWPSTGLITLRVSLEEAEGVSNDVIPNAKDVLERLPELENAVKRDPLSPWLRVELARIYQALGRPGGDELLLQAVKLPSDFTELLFISYTLDNRNQHGVATEAFERGYAELWKRGYDPRMSSYLSRLLRYVPPRQMNEQDRPKFVERAYRVGPWGDEAALAWDSYARRLQAIGNVQEAQKWRQRAAEAEANSLSLPRLEMTSWLEIAGLPILAAPLAALLYLFALYLRYLPQRKIQVGAGQHVRPKSIIRSGLRVSFFVVLVSLTIVYGLAAPLAMKPGFGSRDSGETVFLISCVLILAWSLAVQLIRRDRLPAVQALSVAGLVWALSLVVFLWHDEPLIGALAWCSPTMIVALALTILCLWRKRKAYRAGPFTFWHIEYWNWRERTAFLVLAAGCWLSFGLWGTLISTTVRLSGNALTTSPIWFGRFGGPAEISRMESLPNTRERDLLLAMAYQQDGQTAKAETLYRMLPDFPEAWNNLGVLLKETNHGTEARQAFDAALRLAPSMAEAKLNEGAAPGDLWTELHQKYSPGTAMLVPPTHEHFLRAVIGGAPWKVALNAWRGPWSATLWRWPYRAMSHADSPRPYSEFTAFRKELITAIFLAFAVLMFVPRRDVTQAAPRHQTIVELLLPGTGPEWRAFGGVALAVWLSAILWVIGGRYPFYSYINLPQAFGVPVDPAFLNSVGEPHFFYAFVIIGLVLAMNVFLILYFHRKDAVRFST